MLLTIIRKVLVCRLSWDRRSLVIREGSVRVTGEKFWKGREPGRRGKPKFKLSKYLVDSWPTLCRMNSRQPCQGWKNLVEISSAAYCMRFAVCFQQRYRVPKKGVRRVILLGIWQNSGYTVHHLSCLDNRKMLPILKKKKMKMGKSPVNVVPYHPDVGVSREGL